MATPSEDYVRKLITESGLSIREIARRADLDDHQALNLWFRGTTASLRLEIADKVCLALTGKHLIESTGGEAA